MTAQERRIDPRLAPLERCVHIWHDQQHEQVLPANCMAHVPAPFEGGAIMKMECVIVERDV